MNLTAKLQGCMLRTIAAHDMIPEGSPVTVGFSGGADSTALLLLLYSLADRLSLRLSAVHVNHGIRGQEADRDEAFCKELCTRYHIPFSSVHVDAPSYAAKTGRSMEEAARILRYGALSEASGGGLIATAHNCGDNAETILFNIIRGTGLKGLCGIPYKRGNIIRPLLDISREDIELYLREQGESFVTDSTNLSDDYTRNRIRHRIIPEMKAINPSFTRAVLSLKDQAYVYEDHLAGCLDRAADIRREHPAVRHRAIAEQLSLHGLNVSSDRVRLLDELLMSGRSTRYQLSGSIFAVFDRDGFHIADMTPSAPFSQQIHLPRTGETVSLTAYDRNVTITRRVSDILLYHDEVNKNLTYTSIDCDKIQGGVILRTRRPGDKILLPGRAHRTELKKLYSSLKLPAEQRDKALVMEDEQGLIWSEYAGTAARAAANEHTRDIITIEIGGTADGEKQ